MLSFYTALCWSFITSKKQRYHGECAIHNRRSPDVGDAAAKSE